MSITAESEQSDHDESARGGLTSVTPSTPAVVYLAAARNTYGTRSYRLAVQRVVEEWPDAVVMDTAGCGFASSADWRLRWPFIRDGIDTLVVLSEDDGTISQDTWRELRDATDAGLPCWIATGDGRLTTASSVRFRVYPSGARTDRHWARIDVPPAA